MQLGITDNKIWFEWYLNGSNGANFILYREHNHTKEDVLEAKKWLKNNHDVVRIEVKPYQSKAHAIKATALSTISWFEKTHNIEL